MREVTTWTEAAQALTEGVRDLIITQPVDVQPADPDSPRDITWSLRVTDDDLVIDACACTARGTTAFARLVRQTFPYASVRRQLLEVIA